MSFVCEVICFACVVFEARTFLPAFVCIYNKMLAFWVNKNKKAAQPYQRAVGEHGIQVQLLRSPIVVLIINFSC